MKIPATIFARMQQVDYLITGQGISGSVLAMELLSRGRSVAIIDSPEFSRSSHVAAGAFNPFNFRTMQNNWKADALAPLVRDFYRKCEQTLGAEFFHERKIFKILTGENEKRQWENACREKPGLFADPLIRENPFASVIDAPYGMGVVNEAGNISTGIFLDSVKENVRAAGNYFTEKFEFGLLHVSENEIVYADTIRAKHIVFCMGFPGKDNPFFPSLPLRAVKGQTIHVHIPGLNCGEIINRGVYLLPLEKEYFVCGATFENDRADEIPDEAGKQFLLSRLENFIRVPLRVESVFAGVRPAVKDRRPLAGTAQGKKNVAVFNGMGSKAVFLSPWLAKCLADHFEKGDALPVEVDVNRFVTR
ncbi:MAG TPA: FAD-dependent oxidoreductase [Bacteroidia bacterium]|nr:FAD-dependent oxidoreductase [Bacteroidia bacterium]